MKGFDTYMDRRKVSRAYDLVATLTKRKDVWRIFRHLAKQDEPVSVQAIQKRLGIEQSVVSNSLRYLRFHRVVTRRRQGKHILYEINEKRFEQIANAMISMNSLP